MEKSEKIIIDLVKSTLCIVVFSISMLQIPEYEKSEFVISVFLKLTESISVEKKLELEKLELEKEAIKIQKVVRNRQIREKEKNESDL